MHLPSHLPIIFALTTFLTLAILNFTFDKSSSSTKRSIAILLCLLAWLIIQAIVSLKNFYSEHSHDLPPRFALLVAPPVITIILIFITKRGRAFIDRLSLEYLTWLHIVRIPVELTLYGLFTYKAVPELMTFAGRNFDIISGITAPFIAYFGFRKKILSRKVILAWNFLALALLLNIVINAVLSAPFAFQKFAFDQPNIAVLHFPFVWLPCFIVPAVLFAHLVSIRRLWK